MRLRGLKDVVDDQGVDTTFARARALLGAEETALLAQLLEADDVILERQTRGIVDQVLHSNRQFNLRSILILKRNGRSWPPCRACLLG